MTTRVLFVLLWRSAPYSGAKTWGSSALAGDMNAPGAKPLSHGLLNSATFVVDMLVEAGVEAQLVHVASDNDIWKEIMAYDPTHVVIEACWMRPKKLDDLGALFPAIEFIIRGHSSTPFLAQDTYGFPWTLDYLQRGGIVAPNDMRFLREVRFLAKEIFPTLSQDRIQEIVPYLPNYYPVDHTQTYPNVHDHTVVDIGCFGAARPMKNVVGQAIAAMMFADRIERRLRFHINGDRIECGGGPTVKALEAIFAASPTAELIRHDWMPHAEFKTLISTMDLVTQVSFAETFCIVAADAASQGVPLVTSKEVPWGAPLFQADPTDVRDMAEVMNRAWETRFANRFIDPNRIHLRAYCERVRDLWLDYFVRGDQ